MDRSWTKSHSRTIEKIVMSRGIESCVPSKRLKNICVMIAVEVLLLRNNIEEAIDLLREKTKYPITRRTDYVFGLINLCICAGDRQGALNAVQMYIEQLNSPHYVFKKLKIIIEGHIYYSTKNHAGCSVWVRSALGFLSEKLDFDLFALCSRVISEVLLELPEEAEKKILSKIRYEDEKYINSAEDPKSIKLFSILLRRHKIDTKICDKVHLLRNPLTKKEEVILYFQKYPKDKETLKYILERRKIKELQDLAKDLGIYSKDVKNQFEPFPWIISPKEI